MGVKALYIGGEWVCVYLIPILLFMSTIEEHLFWVCVFAIVLCGLFAYKARKAYKDLVEEELYEKMIVQSEESDVE